MKLLMKLKVNNSNDKLSLSCLNFEKTERFVTKHVAFLSKHLETMFMIKMIYIQKIIYINALFDFN